MKKILLLGGSAQQVIAIETAQKLGYYTVLCDYLSDNPGQFVADKFYQESTTDKELILKIAREEKIDGVLAYASDPAAPTAAYVAEKMGLPGNPYKATEILGVKHLFRDFLETHKFYCPQHHSFSPDVNVEDLKQATSSFHFPVIVKPTDSSGSKGVTKLYSFDDIEKAIQHANSYSRNKVLIIEEFISRGFPYVIGGDIFVWNGKIVLFGLMSCLRGYNGQGLIPIGEMWPSGMNDIQLNNVQKELQRVVDELDIKIGELNVEILLDEKDQPHFLELGPRAGGNMIPLQISDVFNINLVEANVQAAMGYEPKLHQIPNSGFFMHYVLHSYEDGFFDYIDFDPKIEEKIYRKAIYKKKGDAVEFFDGAGKALGIIFLRFSSKDEMSYFCENHQQLVHVHLKNI